MRRLYYIAAIAVTLLAAMPLQAQEETTPPAQQAARKGPRASRGERTDKKNTGLPDLTVRAQEMNERLTQEIGNARWMRARGQCALVLSGTAHERTAESLLVDFPVVG